MSGAEMLLPNGFMDTLFPEAAQHDDVMAHLKTVFGQFGYRNVKPPMVEFEDAFLKSELGAKMAVQSLRMVDPVSQKMMVLRPDITLQIARMAQSRLKDAPRPLRLCYGGDVLRVKGGQLRPERQFAQAGCEQIGDASIAASVENALCAIMALLSAGVSGLCLDVAAPDIIRSLLDGVKGEKRFEIVEAISGRDTEYFKNLTKRKDAPSKKLGKTLLALEDAFGEAPVAIKQLGKILTGTASGKKLASLTAFFKNLNEALKQYGVEDQVHITLDVLELRGFEYQEGPCFTLFARDIRGELGRGGLYKAGNEPAQGFTLYMDTVLRALAKPQPLPTVFCLRGQGYDTLRHLQEDGWNVVRGDKMPKDKKALQAMGCTHVFDNKKIKQI